MTRRLRHILDKLFTSLAGLSVLLMAASLVVILGPILWNGAGAVVFRGTVEFRRLQWGQHGRGSNEAVQAELAGAQSVRRQAYDILDHFQRGLNTEDQHKQARQVYRELGKELLNRPLSNSKRAEIREGAKELRDDLEQAYDCPDKDQARKLLDEVLQHAGDEAFRGSQAERFFDMARDYRTILQTVDLGRRAEYLQSLQEVREEMRLLLGPRPDEPVPPLMMDQYGCTRWDQAQAHLDRLLWGQTWKPGGPGNTLQKVRLRREEFFAGTELAGLFPLVENRLDRMLLPRWTFYWQFFVDSSIPGHFFGGVGPEILGTLLLTVCSMLLAVPLGIVAAAYLVECTHEGLVVRIIRMCINTLAGVPSIVFGLFGLAFFVLTLLPPFLHHKGSSIWAGAMTLALLVLPVIIRASEEAIRSVPQTYKEAAMALGAGKLRTFLKVQLPAALPGILTGVILSMSRAAGETAPILFTAATAFQGQIPHSLGDPTMALPYSSYDMAVGDRIAKMVPHQQFGMVMTLILLVLGLNVAAIVIRSRVARRLRGQ